MLPRSNVLFLVLGASIASAPQSQTVPQSNGNLTQIVKAKARLVLVDVVVTNGKGDPARSSHCGVRPRASFEFAAPTEFPVEVRLGPQVGAALCIFFGQYGAQCPTDTLVSVNTFV